MRVSDVIDRALQVYGAFSREEMSLLYDMAVSCGEKAVFVEIGSYCGRSSTILGIIAKENNCDLTCIDNFITSAPNILDVRQEFEKNMKRYDCSYHLIAMDSKKAVRLYNKKIDLLFIDGDHRYEGVKLDCQLWLLKLKPGGFILFHDYESSWEGVKRAVDEITGEYKTEKRIQTLIAKRKPSLR